MNLKTAFWTAGLMAVTLSLQGCFTTMKTMTHEEAVERDKADQEYNEKGSLASNICRYMQIHCPKSVQMSKKEFAKLSEKASGKSADTGIEISKLGGVMLGSAWLFPTSLTSTTNQIGAGWFFLGGGLLLSALTPDEWTYSRVLAFIPVNKAKTAEEAQKYFMDALVQADKKVIKDNKFKIVKTDEGVINRGEYLLSYKDLFIEGKDICPLTQDGQSSCVFSANVIHGGINAVKTKIPSWLPNGGQEAWRISRTSSIFNTGVYSYSKVTQRDLLVQIAKYLPDDFYVYVPATKVGDEKIDGPAFIISNKQVYPFITVYDSWFD